MKVSSTSPVAMNLKRGGGSIILARVDFWSATPTGWKLIASANFQNVASKAEAQSTKLAKGQYSVVFTCRVEESVNGIYDFKFDVAGVALYADSGNVNTTSDPHDSKVYKDQFVLDVT
jgi:hypothetical protein